MSVEPCPAWTADPEHYSMTLTLKGAGSGVIPVLQDNKHGVTIARTGAGAYTLTFGEEPGPTFLGLDPEWGDATASNVIGWTAVSQVFTKRSGGTKATLTFTTANSSFAAADMAATSTLWLRLNFKLAAPKL